MGALEENFSPIKKLAHNIKSFCRDEDGATAIEYSLIVGLIFLTIVGAVRSYSDSTSEMYGEIESALDETN